MLDGVYTQGANPLAPPDFHPASPLTDQDVVQLAAVVRRRVLRHLRRVGRLPRESCAADEAPEPDEPLFAQLCAQSTLGRGARPLRPEPASARRGRRRSERPLFIPGELCADVGGFSLHAKVAIRADDRDGRERLCRYVARPALKVERLSIQKDGRVVWRLRRRWRDGTGALVFEPLDFIARLAALVPRPRAHLLTYHGVLAPAAQMRDLIVPGPCDASAPAGATELAASEHDSARATAGERACAEAHSPSRPRASRAASPSPRPARSSWAELLRRAFAIDVLTCPRCGGARRLIAMITQRSVIERILGHLGLPSAPERLARARAPPELEFAG